MTDIKRKVLDKNLAPFEQLVAIMAVLRSKEGCAWDRKQTHKSLLPYLIEETYEVVESIEAENYKCLCEELGDLLCQVVFHAQLAKEHHLFDINDAVNSINEKLIKRHPHVFDEKRELNPKQVRSQWEKIKVDLGEKKSVLAGLPVSMPALTMAYRIGEKAGGVGFDWQKAKDVIDKIDEELRELKAEISSYQTGKLSEELGDLLFAVASLARKLEVNPEQSLKQALRKFSERFCRMERLVNDLGKKLDDFSLEQLEEFWQKVK